MENGIPGLFLQERSGDFLLKKESRRSGRMGRSRLYLIFLLCLFIMFAGSFPHEAVGDEVEEVVVTATRVETPVKEVGSSVTVITGDEMKKHGDRYLGDTLRRVAGISVTRSGGPGTLTSVYMRGLKSGNVLVLVNGVEVNDPSSISRDFDFGTLTVEDVERIEIIRGPQSVLYGSDAVGGVINIITKKGIKGRGYSLGVEYGSFETRSIQGSVRAGWSDSLLALTFSSHHTGGISVANASNGNDERDGFGKESITLNGETAINEHLRINFFGKYEETETDLDDYNNATFLFQDDLFYTQDLDRFTGKAEVSLDIFEGRFENIFGIMGTSTQRKLSDDPDSINPDWKRFSYWGKWRRVYYQGNYYLSDHLTLTGGIEAEEEKFFQDEQGSVFFKESISEKATRTESYFAQVLYASDFISGGAGARVDSHDRFGDELTYRLHASVNLGETGILLRASYGTGFKAPTLFQLYSKKYGDPNLKPEKTKGFDAGVEGDFLDGTLSGKFTWFYID
ncbi:MAG: TonB-dependent receptor, partial [Deltaproteobacteria bacterium]